MREAYFEECVFADDLTAWRAFNRPMPDESFMKRGRFCQDVMHQRGAANQVMLEPTKECITVLPTTAPAQTSFRLLGIPLDSCLSMANAVAKVMQGASRRLCDLLRCRRFTACRI